VSRGLGDVYKRQVININNTDATSATAVDASLFGTSATSIKQVAKAANVTKLAATTTAVIKSATLGANLNAGTANTVPTAGTLGSSLTVSAATTAASASVSLDSVKGDSSAASAVAAASGNTNTPANATVANQAVLAVNGAALSTVTVAGTLAKNTSVTDTATLKLDVTTGKNVQSATVTTAVSTTLSVTRSSDSTKDVTSVDASASAGAVTYSAASTVASVKSGAGADDITLATVTAKDDLNTAIDETVNANVATNAGKDKLTVNTSGAGSTTATTGDGNDTITITGISSGTVTIDAGAGDDVIKSNATLTTKTSISGGDGVDTVELAGAATYTPGDYALVDAAFTNVETLKFVTNAAGNTTAVDASQFVDFNKFVFTAAGSNTIAKVGTQALELAASATALDATANGYVAASGSTATAYAGALTVATGVNSSTVTLKADSATVTVNTDATAGASAANIGATVAGDLKTLNIALNSVRNSDADGVATGSESIASATVDLDTNAAAGTAMTLNAMTTVKVTGSGSVTIDAADGSTSTAAPAGKLTSIDLSGMTAMANLDVNGDQYTSSSAYGYQNLSASTVTLNDAVAETLALGGADDTVNTNSTYAKIDTISGFELAALATSATTVNAAKSDAINVGGTIAFSKMTVTATSLAGAFLDAAAVANSATTSGSATGTVFVFDGNTYLFVDGNGYTTGSGSANGILDADDVVVKLVGVFNEALLAQVAG
jgi:hypothetical protein